MIRKQDVKLAREVKETVVHLFFQLTMVYQCKGIIQEMNRDFSTIPWKDRARARQLIDQQPTHPR